MTERQPGQPNGIDKEAWRMTDKEVQRYRYGYADILNAYGFLNKIFFAGRDGMALGVSIMVSDEEYEVDAEDFFRAAFPVILTTIAERLEAMGQAEFVIDVNEAIKEDWRML